TLLAAWRSRARMTSRPRSVPPCASFKTTRKTSPPSTKSHRSDMPLECLVIYVLINKPEGKELEVWLEDKQFDPPKDGAGLDGIAIGGDGNIYVNTFTKGEFFRVEVREGRPGKVTRLATSRPLKLPDGLLSDG